MNRKEIYDRYLNQNSLCFLSVKRKSKKDTQVDGVYYYCHVATDINVTFYTAVQYIGYGDITHTDDADVITLKCRSGVKDKPVISYECKFNKELKGYKNNFIIDTLECDFLNIISINFDTRSKCSNYIGALFSKDRKLKPVSATGIFGGENFVGLEENLRCLDLSELAYTSYLFESMNIEELDFDSCGIYNLERADFMFRFCHNLKRVTGGSKFKLKSSFEMFYNCTELEYVDPTIFEGSLLERVGAMFYECKNLLNVPLNPENVNNSAFMPEDSWDTQMFSGCNKIDTEAIMKFCVMFPPDNISSVIKTVRDTFKCGDVVINDTVRGIFSKCRVRVLDLSKAVLKYVDRTGHYGAYNIEGIVDLFNERYLSPYEIYLEKSEKHFKKVPEIIFINDTVKIHSLDYKIFEIVRAGDLTQEDIDNIIAKHKMFSSGDKLVFIM